jgi:ABC-type antimicrobial peptide transport system permease subunit
VIEKEALLISLIGLVVGFAVSLAAGYLIHRAYGLFSSTAGRGRWLPLPSGCWAEPSARFIRLCAANLDPVQALAYD